MIKEAYVSFETAKLLKEKGFDGYSFYVYILNEEGEHCLERLYDDDFFEKEIMIYAPTQQLACRWLREVHNLCIIVANFEVEGGEKDETFIHYCFEVVYTTTALFAVDANNNVARCDEISDDDYVTYEEAVEAAIRYSLENLI